jgi:hypothetical protein
VAFHPLYHFTMKAIKRIFKRKKKESTANVTVPSTDTNVAGAADGLVSDRNQASQQTSQKLEDPKPSTPSAPKTQNQAPAKDTPYSEKKPMKSPIRNNNSKAPAHVEFSNVKVHHNGSAPLSSKPTVPETAKSVENNGIGGFQSDNSLKTKSDGSQAPQSKKVQKGVAESLKMSVATPRVHGRDSKFSEVALVSNAGETYDKVPLLEQTRLPRGGISIETKALGRIQVCLL